MPESENSTFSGCVITAPACRRPPILSTPEPPDGERPPPHRGRGRPSAVPAALLDLNPIELCWAKLKGILEEFGGDGGRGDLDSSGSWHHALFRVMGHP